jgi:hypothetical protein
MHRRWRELWGNPLLNGSLCWVAPSQVMNPTLEAGFIARKLAEDPVRARSEYLAEWRSTDADFVPDDAIQACTDWGIRERPPATGLSYFAFVDGAGGTGQDSFTMGIAHREGDALILDCLRERRPRFVPAEVVAEFATTLRDYGLRQVTGDRFSGGWVTAEFSRNGIVYQPSALTKSELYLATLPMLLSGRARLLDNERLRSQLSGLERRSHAGGRESVDHGSGAGARDDLCNSACGALALVGRRRPPMQISQAALDQISAPNRRMSVFGAR